MITHAAPTGLTVFFGNPQAINIPPPNGVHTFGITIDIQEIGASGLGTTNAVLSIRKPGDSLLGQQAHTKPTS